MPEQYPKYRIKKITQEGRICPTCAGKKMVRVNLGRGIFNDVSCSTCKGTGVYKADSETDIDLKTALNEIGMYNLIRNTVKDVLTESKDAMHCVSTNTNEQTK
jgi:predicted nucleic-acid-binding Zn-ribbon protein